MLSLSVFLSLLAAGAAFITAARFCAPYRLATDGFQTEDARLMAASLTARTERPNSGEVK
jgi:hypothetical protein